MVDHWTDRAPQMLLSDDGPDGDHCPTPADRRWLWRLEGFLAVYGTNDTQRQMGNDLRAYLNETCEHVWRPAEAYEGIPAHQQCLWCHDVEWTDDPAAVTP